MLADYNDTQEEENNLRDYLKLFLRRKWIIVSFVVVIVAITTIHSLKTVPIYRTTVKLMIDQQNPNVVSFEEVLRLSTQGTAYYQSQLEILESRSLARRVIKTLNLKDSPEFKPDGKTKKFSIKDSLIGKLHSKAKSPENESQKSVKDRGDSGLVGRYLSRLKTKPIKGSYVVNISFEGVHPEIITTIANRHAHEYIEQNLEMRFAASQDAVKWLKKQILEEKKKVETAENALQLFKEGKQIVSLEERQNIVVQKLKDLNSTLTNTRTERIGLETLYNQTIIFAGKPDMMKTIPKIANSTLIEGLKIEYINLQSEIAKLSDKFGEKYPAMIKLVSHARALEKTINSEVDKMVKGIKTEYEVALSREENLSRALEEQKKVALDLNRKAIAYGTLVRDAESERAMYDILIKRLKETDITGELKTSNISIIDLAEVPKSSIRPRTKNNILFAALIGLSLGVGMAFLLERLDNTIKSSADVERYLGVPVLGTLERVRVPKDKKQPFSEIIAHDIPKSTFAEAIRNVRTSIIFSSTDSPKKLLLITSALQGEGKTFIASNLAITIAQAGKNTLLVDTDFRRPKIDKVFNIERDPGLSNYLIGESDFESIIRSTHVPNLSIATCGLIPPNPSEILGSHSMETFCKSVRERFDTVLFDTPPSMTVTDAFVLSQIVDGVIFIIKSGQTVKEAARKAVSQMTDNEHEVMGVVMNYIDVSKAGYYHYYSHYYENESDIEKSSNETDKV